MATSTSVVSSYSYQQAATTYTLDDFIACQSDTMICYNNLSFIDHDDDYNIDFAIWNVCSDYIKEIQDMCKTIVLSDDQLAKYMYRPKLLCYDIYSNGELFFIILMINDMYSIKQFTKQTLLMPTKTDMSSITKQLYNSNKTALQEYANTEKLSE